MGEAGLRDLGGNAGTRPSTTAPLDRNPCSVESTPARPEHARHRPSARASFRFATETPAATRPTACAPFSSTSKRARAERERRTRGPPSSSTPEIVHLAASTSISSQRRRRAPRRGRTAVQRNQFDAQRRRAPLSHPADRRECRPDIAVAATRGGGPPGLPFCFGSAATGTVDPDCPGDSSSQWTSGRRRRSGAWPSGRLWAWCSRSARGT